MIQTANTNKKARKLWLYVHNGFWKLNKNNNIRQSVLPDTVIENGFTLQHNLCVSAQRTSPSNDASNSISSPLQGERKGGKRDSRCRHELQKKISALPLCVSASSSAELMPVSGQLLWFPPRRAEKGRPCAGHLAPSTPLKEQQKVCSIPGLAPALCMPAIYLLCS